MNLSSSNLKAAWTLLICSSALCLPAQSAYPQVNCAAELDATVAMASNNDHDPQVLEERFATLESVCTHYPQLAHNQGVLTARTNKWPKAIAHFERALKMDARAANTHRHLQQIFEYRAAQAYARALNTVPQVAPPEFTFQHSGSLNTDIQQSRANVEPLRDVATIEYELFAWWQAHRDTSGAATHYVDGYNTEAIRLANRFHSASSWPDTQREIAFTREDAVVVLSQSGEAHTLLLLRLVGTRWKIYQETRL